MSARGVVLARAQDLDVVQIRPPPTVASELMASTRANSYRVGRLYVR